MNETTIAVLAAVAGGTGAFLGASLSTFANFRSADRAHRREQLRRDAETLAPIWEYVRIEINPERLALNAPATEPEAIKVHARLMASRDQHLSAVNVMASGHPDVEVRAAAREFATELFNAGVSAGWVLSDPIGDGRMRGAANDDHRNVTELLEKLHKLTTSYGDK